MILLQVCKMSLTIGNHAQKSPSGVVVLAMLLQMIGKFMDLLAQKSNLNLGRTAILVVDASFLDDLNLLT